MTNILITRPENSAKKTAEDLRAMGFTPYIAPMLTLNAAPFMQPDPASYQGILFTSAQAIPFLTKALPAGSPLFDLPAFCVGQKTAYAAQKAGFKTVHSADGNAGDLVALIHSQPRSSGNPYLYPRAEITAYPLTDHLQEHDIAVEELIVYRASPTESFPSEELRALQRREIDYVLFFSARTAENFVRLITHHALEKSLTHTKALSISGGVLGYLKDLQWDEVLCAPSPRTQDLYDLLRSAESPKNRENSLNGNT